MLTMWAGEVGEGIFARLPHHGMSDLLPHPFIKESVQKSFMAPPWGSPGKSLGPQQLCRLALRAFQIQKETRLLTPSQIRLDPRELQFAFPLRTHSPSSRPLTQR